MGVIEHQLSITVNGVEQPMSPITEATTVYTSNGERVSDVLDRNTPIDITYQDYLDKIKSGEITEDDETYYNVIDDIDGITISDSTVSRTSTFSSKKIVELIAAGGGTGGSGGGGASVTKYTQSIQSFEWTQGSRPSTATMRVSGVSTDSLVFVTLSDKLSVEDRTVQATAVTNAKIFQIKASDNSLTFYAYGTIPTVPIQIDISVIN